MRIALLTIGTELTRGELHNANSTWLAAELSERGYEVLTMLTVDDDRNRIVNSLRSLGREHDAILTTGGLGPTTDDLTTACAAEVLGTELLRDEASLRHIRSLFASRGRTMTPSNEKQADFPRGATVLPNGVGTAPGFLVEHEGCQMFFMPGVPAEMHPMFEKEVLGHLRPPTRPVLTERLMTFGMPEAEVNDRLRGLEEEHDVTLGYRASNSQIEVKVLTEIRPTEDESAARGRAAKILTVIEERLEGAAYGRGRTSLAAELGRSLSKRGWSLGLAESCTGGLVSQMVTSVAGASAYYLGGVCSYANDVKENVLHVPRAVIDEHGVVSEPVVRKMAEGAREVLRCDVSIALSGIAGPSGGTQEKPVGLVHWAVATPSAVHAYHHVFFGDRSAIQKRASLSGLASALRVVREGSR